MHFNAGPERDLEPKPTCEECGIEVNYTKFSMCSECYSSALEDSKE